MVKSMFQALCTAISDFNSFGLLFPESFHLWQFSACLSFLPSVVIFLKAVRVKVVLVMRVVRLADTTSQISPISVHQSRGLKGVKVRFMYVLPPLLRSISQESPVCAGCHAERSLAVFQISRYHNWLSEKNSVSKGCYFQSLAR